MSVPAATRFKAHPLLLPALPGCCCCCCCCCWGDFGTESALAALAAAGPAAPGAVWGAVLGTKLVAPADILAAMLAVAAAAATALAPPGPPPPRGACSDGPLDGPGNLLPTGLLAPPPAAAAAAAAAPLGPHPLAGCAAWGLGEALVLGSLPLLGVPGTKGRALIEACRPKPTGLPTNLASPAPAGPTLLPLPPPPGMSRMGVPLKAPPGGAPACRMLGARPGGPIQLYNVRKFPMAGLIRGLGPSNPCNQTARVTVISTNV
jgi:hypothetical protein